MNDPDAFLGAREANVQSLNFEFVLYGIDSAVKADREDVVQCILPASRDHGIEDLLPLLALAGINGHDLQAKLILEIPRSRVVEQLLGQERLLLPERRYDTNRRGRWEFDQLQEAVQDEIRLSLIRASRRTHPNGIYHGEANHL
nr:hypothetical protein [Arenimonas caeni]